MALNVLMHCFPLYCLLFLTTHTASAQIADDWTRFRNYAHAIGVDSLCAQPDPACLRRYFTQIIYGRVPRRISYQGISERIDTVSINRLIHQFLDRPLLVGSRPLRPVSQCGTEATARSSQVD
ncbi:MAG: ErfK/YbiS/YcfS/YnhG family protein [Spirosoma sp.]|nr:ErfK/YbiS/YcfS/YnhG family protein [Spirosoma sp.]